MLALTPFISVLTLTVHIFASGASSSQQHLQLVGVSHVILGNHPLFALKLKICQVQLLVQDTCSNSAEAVWQQGSRHSSATVEKHTKSSCKLCSLAQQYTS
eukprot:1159742-Pelagomonas_calceolata.AAC.1